MKKIVISIAILIATSFLAVFLYNRMTTEEVHYDFTNFNQVPEIIAENEKVIVFVVQDGCSPCKLVEPIINDYAKEQKGVVHAIVSNKEKDYSIQSKKYNIEGTPTLIFYKNGTEIYRKRNGFTADEFHQMIQKVDF